jgi:hypothetical protein
VLSVVVPVYRNADSVPELLDAMDTISSEAEEDVQAVFVVDGSPDQSFALLRDLCPSAAASMSSPAPSA